MNKFLIMSVNAEDPETRFAIIEATSKIEALEYALQQEQDDIIHYFGSFALPSLITRDKKDALYCEQDLCSITGEPIFYIINSRTEEPFVTLTAYNLTAGEITNNTSGGGAPVYIK